jgi:ankyrin repeat protein
MNNDDDYEIKLLIAIVENDRIKVSSLIANGGVGNFNGLLLKAASLGRLEMVAMLLDAGADINAIDENNQTALHFAICLDYFAVLKLLVERGANVGVIRPPRESLLRCAMSKRNDRVVICLLDAGAPLNDLSDWELMNLCTQPNSVAVLKRLVARNVDVGSLRESGRRTLCHRVARTECDEQFLRALVSIVGVDVNAVDFCGATPLHYAAMECNLWSVHTLVEFGADIDHRDDDGRTSLHRVHECDRDGPCMELLLALGANASLVTRRGQSATHGAAQRRRPFALCALLAAEGDLDQPDRMGDTPRELAYRRHLALPTVAEIAESRKRIAKARLDLVRHRAGEIFIGLQPLNISALQLCEIAMHSFGALGALVEFHLWWKIATTVKHFH